MRIAPGFIAAKKAASAIPRVSSLRAQASTTTSASGKAALSSLAGRTASAKGSLAVLRRITVR